MGRLRDLIDSALSAEPRPEATAAWTELSDMLRTYARVHMGARVRATSESMDVVNSLLDSFLADLRAERIAFESEENLRAYLLRMTRRKMTDLMRRASAEKRGGGAADQPIGAGSDGVDPTGRDPHPSVLVRDAEFVANLRRLATPEDARIWELHAEGASWGEIGARVGLSPDTARKRFVRLRDHLRAEFRDRDPI